LTPDVNPFFEEFLRKFSHAVRGRGILPERAGRTGERTQERVSGRAFLFPGDFRGGKRTETVILSKKRAQKTGGLCKKQLDRPPEGLYNEVLFSKLGDIRAFFRLWQV